MGDMSRRGWVVVVLRNLLSLGLVSFAAFPNEITSHGGQIGRLADAGPSSPVTAT